jgi:hypothetical protein
MIWSDPTTNTGILQEIRRSLKQPATDGLWADTEYLRRANIVMRKICEESECLKTIDTSNTSVSGTADYNKPSGCSRLTRVAYGNQRVFGILKAELDMTSFQSGSEWQTLTRTPTRYIDKPTSITLLPYPNDTGTVITMEYIAQPTELTAVGDIPFNAQNNLYSFHDLIVAGVVYRCMLEDRNQFYMEWKSIYEKGILKLKDFVRNQPDTFMSMILVSGRNSGKNISPMPFV